MYLPCINSRVPKPSVAETLPVSNNFLLKKDNTSFNKLFNFYLTLNSDNEMRSLSTKKIYGDARNNILLSFVLKNILYIITLQFYMYIFKSNKDFFYYDKKTRNNT